LIRLLVSVKNVQEALDAIAAGADFIDLKDPSQGALGSLDNALCEQIVLVVNQRAMVSATIGDTHVDTQTVLDLIEEKWALGVDIVKLPWSLFFNDKHFLYALGEMLREKKMKLIAVINAEHPVNLSWISLLAETGFYGVMLDTVYKGHHLLSLMDIPMINAFIMHCKKHDLQAGVAGALRAEHLPELMPMQPSFVGFRSGVCESKVRENKLLPHLVNEIKDKLHKHNRIAKI
jgi:dihydroneopterin aldolase